MFNNKTCKVKKDDCKEDLIDEEVPEEMQGKMKKKTETAFEDVVSIKSNDMKNIFYSSELEHLRIGFEILSHFNINYLAGLHVLMDNIINEYLDRYYGEGLDSSLLRKKNKTFNYNIINTCM
ncbi:hypothetical protein NGRA_2463 [Nosema granulosis]|uniref:Uncharacterized protein n=1 Tax=Nosema granulosis TaxID=83296 RepID=A0A9P6GZB5_9MICR|nr:hypothetical protein NGRA_2463 [Nosema granulosis]